MKNLFCKILNLILSFIYPDKCIFCGDIIPRGSEDKYVCPNCNNELVFYEDNKENFVAIFEYKGIVKDMIHRFKFRFHPEYAKGMAEIMAKRMRALNIVDYDYIVAVPMHYKKERKRGFNQTWVLAQALSELTTIEAVKDKLIRIKKTKPQSELDHIQRANNVKNAFEIKEKGFFKDKRIILIDDIYTTGNTINECIKIIQDDKPAKVCVLVFSKTLHNKC